MTQAHGVTKGLGCCASRDVRGKSGAQGLTITAPVPVIVSIDCSSSLYGVRAESVKDALEVVDPSSNPAICCFTGVGGNTSAPILSLLIALRGRPRTYKTAEIATLTTSIQPHSSVVRSAFADYQ